MALPALVLAVLALTSGRDEDQPGTWYGYVNPWFWWASLLLVVPIFRGARRCIAMTSLAVLVAVGLQWFVATAVASRYRAGQAEVDLDYAVLAQLVAILVTVAFVATAVAGWLTGRARARPASAPAEVP